jgi:hypothetical protein
MATWDPVNLAPCPADVSGDRVIDGDDLLLVIEGWPGDNGTLDVNGNGSVDLLDMLEVMHSFGTCP